MENIFVPTDFSQVASVACDAAIQLASFRKAKIHFYHSLSEQLQEAQSAIEDVDAQLKHWQGEAGKANVHATFSHSTGSLIPNIESYVQEVDPDLIVMGSHGVSGKQEYFIGSNTQKTIRKIRKPVLVIKDVLPHFPFKHIVYASSFEQRDESDFQYFLEWVKPFEPVIHLLAINTLSFFTQPAVIMQSALNHFKDLCRPLSCQTHFFRDINIEAGIRHFSDEYQVDLIAISNSRRHPVKRLLSGSTVEFLINHSYRPVLTIDGPQ